jgi:hypothetical protein
MMSAIIANCRASHVSLLETMLLGGGCSSSSSAQDQFQLPARLSGGGDCRGVLPAVRFLCNLLQVRLEMAQRFIALLVRKLQVALALLSDALEGARELGIDLAFP